MPRRNRHPGSGKLPHNGPASVVPAMGTGWGGPAKGAGTGQQRAPAAPPITAETARKMAARSQTAEAKEQRRGTIATREEALIKLSDLMRGSEYDAVQMQAADKLIERLGQAGGPPLVRFNVDRLTSAQRRTLIEALRAGLVQQAPPTEG